jgi:non-ribosomal peptide synthetase component F
LLVSNAYKIALTMDAVQPFHPCNGGPPRGRALGVRRPAFVLPPAADWAKIGPGRGNMYKVDLGESYFPAQTDDVVLETTVGGILRAAAVATPGAEALVEADIAGELRRRWTYAELLADAERLARALLSRYRPGERIAVWAPNIPEWVILEYAAALAGLTLVTANPAYRPRELQFVLQQSRAVGLFFVSEFRGNPMARIAAEVAAELPGLRELIDMEDAAALFAGADASSSLPDVRPGDPVQIQYTSGTTGFPKGAVLHHRGVTNNARYHFARTGARTGDTVINFMPLFHTAGCGLATLGSAQFGCRMILAKLFEPARMLAIVETERVNVLLGVPTMLGRAAGGSGRSSARPVLDPGDDVRRLHGAARVGASHALGFRRPLPDRLRPDRVVAADHPAWAGRFPRRPVRRRSARPFRRPRSRSATPTPTPSCRSARSGRFASEATA